MISPEQKSFTSQIRVVQRMEGRVLDEILLGGRSLRLVGSNPLQDLLVGDRFERDAANIQRRFRQARREMAGFALPLAYREEVAILSHSETETTR